MSAASGARGWVLAVVAAGVTVVAVLAIGAGGGDRPLSPRSHERLGTSAMVALADRLGSEVTIDDRLPAVDDAGGPDVVVLFSDLLSDDQRAALEAWVDQGGRLVVTEPASPLVPVVRGRFDSVDDLAPARTLAGRCEIDALGGIDVGGIDPYRGGVLYEPEPGWSTCVDDGVGNAYIATADRGDGTVVALGGSGMVVNAGLGDGENAAVVAALVAPQRGTEVLVLEPGVVAGGGGGQRTLGQLIPSGVSRALVQLAVAFVVYAVWRARRLGRPVAEAQPVAVAGSELVAAVGNLLDRTKSPAHAAELLRADLRRFLADRVGVPAGAPPDVLATLAADRTGLAEDSLRWALGHAPVVDDAGLVALATTIDRIREEVLDHV